MLPLTLGATGGVSATAAAETGAKQRTVNTMKIILAIQNLKKFPVLFIIHLSLGTCGFPFVVFPDQDRDNEYP